MVQNVSDVARCSADYAAGAPTMGSIRWSMPSGWATRFIA